MEGQGLITAKDLMATGKAGGKEGLITQKTGNLILKTEAEATGGISAAIEGLGRVISLYIKFSDFTHLAKNH